MAKLLRLCGDICRWQHPHTQSSLPCAGAIWCYPMVPRPGPGCWGLLPSPPGAELALAPSLAWSPSLRHRAATSLRRGGQGAWTHWLQVPPGGSSLLPRCPAAAPRGDGYKCRGKAPSCSTTHLASPVETSWPLRSLLLSSMEGNGPVPHGPCPQGCAGGGTGTAVSMMLAAPAGQGALPAAGGVGAGQARNGTA